MAHSTTVFRQLLDLLPRHEFEAEAQQHQEGQRLRVMSRWAQFVALGLGQLGDLQFHGARRRGEMVAGQQITIAVCCSIPGGVFVLGAFSLLLRPAGGQHVRPES